LSLIGSEARSTPLATTHVGDAGGGAGGGGAGGEDHVNELKVILERTVNDLRATKQRLWERNVAVEALAVVVQHVSGKVPTQTDAC
jgi:hypothetical protein